MKKIISIGFLYSAMWVLLVHSIVPHVHGHHSDSKRESIVSIEQDDTLWSQIWEALQFNPGEEHLEHYNLGQQVMAQAILPNSGIDIPTANWFEFPSKTGENRTSLVPKYRCSGNTHRRGPPAA